MNHKKTFFRANTVGFLLAAAVASTMTGCVGYVDGPRGGGYVAAPVQTEVIVQDDYVYYPRYEVYYSNSRRQYAYHEGNAWVSRPAPRGVSVNVLLKSPSVRMDFHDAPANHHTTVVKQYPKNWKPTDHDSRPDNRNDDKHDEHGNNNRR